MIHSWFFPLLPWAAHMAKIWKSMSRIGLRLPLLYLICVFSYGQFDLIWFDLIWFDLIWCCFFLGSYQVQATLPKRPLIQFKSVQQSRQQTLRAYCFHMYSVLIPSFFLSCGKLKQVFGCSDITNIYSAVLCTLPLLTKILIISLSIEGRPGMHIQKNARKILICNYCLSHKNL